MIPKPEKNEYNPFYQGYIDLVVDKDIVAFLKEQKKELEEFFTSLSEEKQNYSYADGKWTIKQVLRHMIDTERVFGYRAMCLARGEKQNLPGFEQDDYIETADDSENQFEYLVGEFVSLRNSNILMIQNLPDSSYSNLGSMSGNPASYRAAIFILAGHAAHHLNVLKERYF